MIRLLRSSSFSSGSIQGTTNESGGGKGGYSGQSGQGQADQKKSFRNFNSSDAGVSVPAINPPLDLSRIPIINI